MLDVPDTTENPTDVGGWLYHLEWLGMHGDKLHTTRDTPLAQQRRHMVAHGEIADIQFQRNLFVGLPLGQQMQNIPFSLSHAHNTPFVLLFIYFTHAARSSLLLHLPGDGIQRLQGPLVKPALVLYDICLQKHAGL